jgi:hypothetical protein
MRWHSPAAKKTPECNIHVTVLSQIAVTLMTRMKTNTVDNRKGRSAVMDRKAHLQKSDILNSNAGLSRLRRNQTDTIYSHHYEQNEKIRPEKLEKFGFRLTARFADVGLRYKLFELLPLSSAQPAEVCFLAPDHKLHGVIVPDPFHEHKARLRRFI